MMQIYHNSRLSEKGRGRGLKRNPQNYLRVTMLSCYIEIVIFPSSLLPIKCTKKSKLTKEPSENACERSSSYRTHCRPGQVEEVSRWCQYRILVEETAYTKDVSYLELDYEWI